MRWGEGGRDGGREGGRWREGGREGGSEGGRWRKRVRDGGSEGGKEVEWEVDLLLLLQNRWEKQEQEYC